MRKVSSEKEKWSTRYYVELRKAKEKQAEENGCTFCEMCGKNGAVDGHHTQGRIGENILVFRLIGRGCHDFIHSNARWARAEGWLG